MFDGIIFDLDGTLWDATPTMEGAWADLLARHPEVSRPPVTMEEIQSNMGLLLADICARMFPALTEEKSMALMDEFNDMDEQHLRAHGGRLFPGEEETLAALARRYPLYIVSNCQDGYVECFYQGNGLSRFFIDSECAGHTGLPKSENIKLMVERHGLKRPVYIGDTILDYTSAVDARVPFFHAAYGFGEVPDVPAVQSFADIPAALEAMEPT